jgi:ornithine cyclodeaminase/alanine dehydrogenase-like protein (mu-crystallin family)
MTTPTPPYIDAAAVARSLPWQPLVEALRIAFAEGDISAPPRQHHALQPDHVASPVLLVMPAWSRSHGIGTKLVTVFPDNVQRGLPSIHGLYVLSDPATGQPLAVIDGGELTTRRTAAASALASKFLSRPDSRTLLMVGTGRLGRTLPLAHAAVRPIERVLIWGRSSDEAQEAAQALQGSGMNAAVAPSLAQAAAQADIISCATLATSALLRGEWLRPGTHVDLVGAFKPTMCEADAEVFARADAVWCDTREGALTEAGDIVQAIAAGAFHADRLAGDLAALCRRGAAPRDASHITVFKSVGMALEDLVAARLCLDALPLKRNP